MRGMLTILGIAGVIFLIVMFSGCSKPETPVVDAYNPNGKILTENIITENIEVEEIRVEGIQVNPIEVKTFENTEISSWD